MSQKITKKTSFSIVNAEKNALGWNSDVGKWKRKEANFGKLFLDI